MYCTHSSCAYVRNLYFMFIRCSQQCRRFTTIYDCSMYVNMQNLSQKRDNHWHILTRIGGKFSQQYAHSQKFTQADHIWRVRGKRTWGRNNIWINPIECGGGRNPPHLSHKCGSPKNAQRKSCQFFVTFPKICEWSVGYYFLQSNNIWSNREMAKVVKIGLLS